MRTLTFAPHNSKITSEVYINYYYLWHFNTLLLWFALVYSIFCDGRHSKDQKFRLDFSSPLWRRRVWTLGTFAVVSAAGLLHTSHRPWFPNVELQHHREQQRLTKYTRAKQATKIAAAARLGAGITRMHTFLYSHSF